MPGGVGFVGVEKVVELGNDLICKIFVQSPSDPTKTLSCGPSDGTVLVLERVKEVLDDELELLKVNFILFLQHIFVLIIALLLFPL